MKKSHKKYKFSPIERFALWKSYYYLCFYCGLNLKWKNLTIDHLFPESLLYNPKRFIIIKKAYSLKSDFCINDFANWVPAHDICNNIKSDFMPHYTTNFAMINKLSNIARSIHDKLLEQRPKDKVLAKLLSQLENGAITTSELYKLIEKTTILYFGFSEIEPEDTINIPVKWLCSSCKRYVPWNGNQCLICGNRR
ncbi:MAG: hypothetical protein FWD60_04945 [Candidatus Azobacteroides sp.]|nr:hypothetical protein [Candidatus Azobacteroides sp.]